MLANKNVGGPGGFTAHRKYVRIKKSQKKKIKKYILVNKVVAHMYIVKKCNL